MYFTTDDFFYYSPLRFIDRECVNFSRNKFHLTKKETFRKRPVFANFRRSELRVFVSHCREVTLLSIKVCVFLCEEFQNMGLWPGITLVSLVFRH